MEFLSKKTTKKRAPSGCKSRTRAGVFDTGCPSHTTGLSLLSRKVYPLFQTVDTVYDHSELSLLLSFK